MVELREYERKTLTTLENNSGQATFEELTTKSGLPDSAVMRAALVLQEKKLARIEEKKQTVISLTDEGKLYANKSLPERTLTQALAEQGNSAQLSKVIQKADLDSKLVPIALGWVQRKKWASLDAQTKTLQMHRIPDEGDDEKLIALLNRNGVAVVENLSPSLKEAFNLLKGRKLLNIDDKTMRIIELTDTGKELLRQGIQATVEVTQLTPELIVSGDWRRAQFQKYNIEASVAHTWPGKKHPYLQFLDTVKQKLVNLGFKEMVGTQVEVAFYHYDALYTPQDHPCREAVDIYFVKSPKSGAVNVNKRIRNNVKNTHENGWKTGSTGWKYRYSEFDAKRLILRGHGTCLSARTLLSKDLEIPGKYFSIARCYRPDVPDRTHLTEFNQVEGIVVGEDLNLQDLNAVLLTFATEIAGAEKVRLKPDYYPFTEPSVELSAYQEGYGWIEFGGSGIFRPEVTLPLGIKVPVIAWGLGVDRLFMIKAGVEDIRFIFPKDLGWIRKQKVMT